MRPTEGPPRPMEDLIFAGPDCPDGCGEVVYDSPGWRCETCEAYWSDGGDEGEQPPLDLVEA